MSTTSAPGQNGAPPANGTSPDPLGFDEILNEAEALRQLLVEASTRAQRLLAALKNQKRQTRAVQAAVASLRQLQLGP